MIPGRRRFDGWWWPDHGVVYANVDRPDGFVRLGTIHSHADLPAYSSAIDCDDEWFEDGLHIVFGNFHRRELSIAATFVVNGVRFRMAPGDVMEPCVLPARPAPREWMARVRRTGDVERPPPLSPPGPVGHPVRLQQEGHGYGEEDGKERN